MLLSCFKNQSFRYLWTAGCFTGIARAMEFLTLSLYILNDFGLAYLITVIFACRMLPMSMLGLIIGSISFSKSNNIFKFTCFTRVADQN